MAKPVATAAQTSGTIRLQMFNVVSWKRAMAETGQVRCYEIDAKNPSLG